MITIQPSCMYRKLYRNCLKKITQQQTLSFLTLPFTSFGFLGAETFDLIFDLPLFPRSRFLLDLEAEEAMVLLQSKLIGYIILYSKKKLRN